MLDLIRKIWRTKTATQTTLFEEAPSRFRGKPVFASNECTGCEACAVTCPAGAISYHKTDDSITLALSYTNCIFCGLCAEYCETNLIQITNEYRLATKNKSDLMASVTINKKAPILVPAGKGV